MAHSPTEGHHPSFSPSETSSFYPLVILPLLSFLFCVKRNSLFTILASS